MSLAWREHRPAETLEILEKSLRAAQIAALGPTSEKRLAVQTRCAFLRAVACAELGRTDDARQSFAQGSERLKAVLEKPPRRDRGAEWLGVYASELLRDEALAVFQAKGIPLPELATK